MADITKPKTAPDYANYTKGVVAGVKARNDRDIPYDKRAIKGDNDNTWKQDPEVSAKLAAEKARKEQIEQNTYADGQRKLFKKDLSGRQAYNKSDGGIPQFKKGGMVKKTGLAKVHKGERVLTKSQTKKFAKKSLSKKRSYK
jgi:hypothetical protein